MYCNKCGADIPDTTSFCLTCGAPLHPQEQALDSCAIISQAGRHGEVEVRWYEAHSEVTGAVVYRGHSYRYIRPRWFRSGTSNDQVASLDQQARSDLIQHLADHCWEPVTDSDGVVRHLVRRL